MKNDIFATATPVVSDNERLRVPQRNAYEKVRQHFLGNGQREVAVVLPVGCGKSGLLAIVPFAVQSRRALLVAPNLTIADQLLADLTPSNANYFYDKRRVLSDGPYPEAAEIRGSSTARGDLDDADIVITNIQQLQREGNRWLDSLPADFFDLIMFDEAHHNVAQSWEALREHFPEAKIVNVSGTPARADGRLMAGEIVYSYPIAEAVRQGYVKRISGHRLNPKTLRYIRREDDREIEVSLDEVRELGEKDASFRRSIVSSEETLTTIVDASIRKLQALRAETGEERLKIIASALNMEHCKQVVSKYQARGLRADFVHSNLDGKANRVVLDKLNRHELDVIVQVRKLGEGFDHPFLSVAAVFSLFSSLSPFVQFVGRVMRVIPGAEPGSPVNEGVVVFHVGANITGVWQDFRTFAEADQEWLANLVDEHIGGDGDQDDVDPFAHRPRSPIPTVTAQGEVLLEDLKLLSSDPEVQRALEVLAAAGVQSGDQFDQLRRIHPSKQETRRANRRQLDERIKTRTGKVLAERGLSPKGTFFGAAHRGKDNFQVVKAAIDRKVNESVGRGTGNRNEFTTDELNRALNGLDETVAAAERELFDVS